MNARSTWTRNIAVALHHTRDYATTKPFPFPLERVVSVYITSSRMPMSRSTLVHGVSPPYTPLTLICNARSANDWTWCSSTDSRDRWMINEERTNMYCPCSSPCLLSNIWIWNTRPCYRRKKMINAMIERTAWNIAQILVQNGDDLKDDYSELYTRQFKLWRDTS